jgi:Ankyrin repeats (many copies)
MTTPPFNSTYALGRQLAIEIVSGAMPLNVVEEYSEGELYYALEYLVFGGHYRCAADLISMGVGPNVRSDNCGQTLLMAAANRMSEPQVDFLLGVGANVSLRTTGRVRHTAIDTYLMIAGNQIREAADAGLTETELFETVNFGCCEKMIAAHVASADKWLDARPDDADIAPIVVEPSRERMRQSSMSVDEVWLLLRDLPVCEETTFQLLKQGYSLHVLCAVASKLIKNDRFEEAERLFGSLLPHGINFGPDETTLLISAAQREDLMAIEFLLNHKVRPDNRDRVHNWTALDYALAKKNLELSLLLSRYSVL